MMTKELGNSENDYLVHCINRQLVEHNFIWDFLSEPGFPQFQSKTQKSNQYKLQNFSQTYLSIMFQNLENKLTKHGPCFNNVTNVPTYVLYNTGILIELNHPTFVLTQLDCTINKNCNICNTAIALQKATHISIFGNKNENSDKETIFRFKTRQYVGGTIFVPNISQEIIREKRFIKRCHTLKRMLQ